MVLYPAALDDLSAAPVVDGKYPRYTDQQHLLLPEAIEAVQAELGVAPSGAYSTVAARLTAGEAESQPSRVTFSNAAVTVAATTRYLAQVGSMGASRTVTLPGASTVPAGAAITVVDESGTVTGANTIVVARAGSDTINGGTSATITTGYGGMRLISDGASKWTSARMCDGAPATISGVQGTDDTAILTSLLVALDALGLIENTTTAE